MNSRILLPPALNASTLASLRSDVVAASGVVVLEGETEGTFCKGLDIANAVSDSAQDKARGLQDFETAILKLLTGSNPCIALVDGDAFGGGLGLASACDLVIASPNARFSLPEPLFGLIPGMITPVIRSRISAPNIRRLAISGESITADEAHGIGLVDVVADASEFETITKRWTRKFSRAYPPAVGRLKTWLANMDQIAAEVRVGAEHLAELLEDPEVQKRVERFRAGDIPWSDA